MVNGDHACIACIQACILVCTYYVCSTHNILDFMYVYICHTFSTYSVGYPTQTLTSCAYLAHSIILSRDSLPSVIEGCVAALFLQEIDEIIYAAFLPAQEVTTVLEFETPVYSKIYTRAALPHKSQRYRTYSMILKPLQKIFTSGISLALVVFTYMAGVTYFIVNMTINSVCPAYEAEFGKLQQLIPDMHAPSYGNVTAPS